MSMAKHNLSCYKINLLTLLPTLFTSQDILGVIAHQTTKVNLTTPSDISGRVEHPLKYLKFKPYSPYMFKFDHRSKGLINTPFQIVVHYKIDSHF